MAIAKPARTSVIRAPLARSMPRVSAGAAWRGFGLNRTALVLPVTRAWAAAPLAVIALIFAGAMLEPAPAAEATGAQAMLEGAIASVFLIGILVSALGAMSLQRWGIASASGLALVTLGLLVSCPVSGHHTWGAWIAGESVLVLAALGVAGTALWKTNRR